MRGQSQTSTASATIRVHNEEKLRYVYTILEPHLEFHQVPRFGLKQFFVLAQLGFVYKYLLVVPAKYHFCNKTKSLIFLLNAFRRNKSAIVGNVMSQNSAVIVTEFKNEIFL